MNRFRARTALICVRDPAGRSLDRPNRRIGGIEVVVP
jgi:hypothetical protein